MNKLRDYKLVTMTNEPTVKDPVHILQQSHTVISRTQELSI